MSVKTEWGEDALLLDCVARAFLPQNPARIGIAVSGGGDSMALLHLAHRVPGWRVYAVTVDHGLRAESAAEAAGVATYCAGAGIDHAVLRWSGPAGVGNLMDQARRARARLMGEWAVAQGIGHMLLGHTADDQAESFLMNLARGAGLDGLSGLRETWAECGVLWHRPLLAQSRAALRGYLLGQNLSWIDDPSNENERYTRIKARKALKALAPLGITVETLGQSISNLRGARQATDLALKMAVEAHVVERAGGLEISALAWKGMAPETARRLLVAAVRWMNGGGYAPRGAKVARVAGALSAGRDATLGGVRFACRAGGVHVTREPRAVAGAQGALGQVWDNRWQVSGPPGADLHIAALGVAGLQAVKDWRGAGISRSALLVSPGIWQGNRLISAPLVQKDGLYLAEIAHPFNRFVLSH